MTLSALAVAAALAGAPPASYVHAPPAVTTERTPNAYKQPAHCKDTTYKVVDRYGRPIPKKLSDLPPGALQYAVDRSIDGCRVITVIYGKVLPDQPDAAGQGRLTPLIKAPAVREDAPSNRR
jgi:hypothetical protein